MYRRWTKMLATLYQLASAPNTNASTDMPTSQCVSQHFRAVPFAVAAESPLYTCSFSHYLFKLSPFLQMMKTGSYSDPLRVTQTASETSSMPAMWMYAALHCARVRVCVCACMCVCVCVCVCVTVCLQPAGLQGQEQIHSCSG